MARRSLSNPLSKRSTVAVLAALSAIVATGCGTEPVVEKYLAEYIPYSTTGVDTDIIFPREQGASRFLIRNWPPLRTLQGESMWIHGSWARLGFFTVSDLPPTLVAEAQPFSHPDAPQQTVTLILNGTEVTTVSMPPGWQTYEFELPAENVRIGWNQIDLDFAHTLRPSDFDPESNERRTLAARFRRLEMRSALGRPYWPDRVEEVRLVLPEDTAPQPASLDQTTAAFGTENDLAGVTIEMPTDSFFEVNLGPGDDTEIVGDLHVTFANSPTEGEIHVVAEVVEPKWTTRVWESVLTPSGAPIERLRTDLSGWTGELVTLRIRVFGSVDGLVRWSGLGTTTSVEGPGAGFDPARIVSPPRSADLDRPDIFIIVLDAARADAFDGSRGADLTPNVGRLAAEGTRFTQAWAPSSWTGQTMPALLAGMTPDAVGIEDWDSQLPASVTKFPEILLADGYRTVLWSQHNIYRSRQSLRHGFEVFEDVDPSDLATREILPAADWMVVEDRPTFALIHILPPHTPYEAPSPFFGSRSSWYKGSVTVDLAVLSDFNASVPQDEDLRDQVRRFAIARYEENVQFADHLVGRLVDDLKRAGRYDDAMIIVLADHGEAFYEHGFFLHSRRLFEEFLHVPFIIKWPHGFDDFEPVIDAPVSLLDVPPTIIDALGINDERALYQGRTLMPLVRGGAAPNRVIYAYASNPGNSRPYYALRWGDMKLIWDERREQASLYDLSTDPLERDDIAKQMPFYTGILTQFLKRARARNARLLLGNGGASVEALGEDTVRSLRALGYLR